MNFQFYAEKLRASDNFRKFIRENRDAFLCGCFFLIDKEEGKDKQHFDFYIPSSKKMLSFPLEEGSEQTFIELKDEKTPAQISTGHDFDFSEIEGMIEKRMIKEGVDKKIQKMLFSLQNVDGRDFLIGTIFIASFGLINMTIDVEKREIKDFKKRTFFDIMNVFKKDK